MAIKYMSSVHIDEYDNKNVSVERWEYDTGELDSSNEGDSIMVPENIRAIIATLYIDGGEGKVQTTTNKLQDVLDDNNVVWVDWDSGSVTTTTQDEAPVVTAIRIYRTSGTVRLMVITR